MVPDFSSLPPGCAFSNRCPLVEAACEAGPMALEPAGEGRLSRCRRWKDLA